MEVPRLAILNETIRAFYFHVPMWFGMIILLLISVIFSVKQLKSNSLQHDRKAAAYANIGVLFGVLGLFTGMFWAKFTWGAYWSGDPKQNASAIGLLIYLAYFVLRNALEDAQQKARISAIYNIFAFATLVPLLFILPRLSDSLHPGSGGNPGFNAYETDNRLKMIFYPAVIAWTLLGAWLAQLDHRSQALKEKMNAKSVKL